MKATVYQPILDHLCCRLARQLYIVWALGEHQHTTMGVSAMAVDFQHECIEPRKLPDLGISVSDDTKVDEKIS